MEQRTGRTRAMAGLGVIVVGVLMTVYAVADGRIRGMLFGGFVVVCGALLAFRSGPASESSVRSVPVGSDGPVGSPGADGWALPDFPVYLRGYETAAVRALADTARGALASDSAVVRAEAGAALAAADLPVALRGYDRLQVDTYFARLAEELAKPGPSEGR